MFVKFTQDVGSWVKDSVYDVEDDVARSFVQLKRATEVNAAEYLRASRKAEDEQLKAEIMRSVADTIKTALQEFGGSRGRAAPPSGGGHVNFGRLAAGQDPADTENDQSKKRGLFTDALRCIGVVGKPHMFAPEFVQHCNRRLQGMSSEATEYRFDEAAGEFVSTTTRQLDGGGVETITRTGTDSLSGGATYGFALKPEYLGTLFEISMEQQVFVDKAQRIPITQGLEAKWPAWDQYRAPTTAGGITQAAVFAGIQLFYAGEITARTPSDAMLNMISFKAVDLTGFTAFSRDFVVDNYISMDAAVTRMFGRAIGWMEDYMSIQGGGLGKPQGYFNGGATLVVNRAASNKIRPADLTAMIAAVSPMVWDGLQWITNITTFPQLSILSDGTNYVFQPNALISQAMKLSAMDKSVGGRGAELMHRPMGDLLGFPVYFSEKVPVLGTTGDLSLVAPSQFGVAERSGLEVAVSEHFYFDTDRIAYRFKKRHDMKSLWRAPYQQADGSNTQVAPFVMLH
jgi:HK97 family phage major capsid protein